MSAGSEDEWLVLSGNLKWFCRRNGKRYIFVLEVRNRPQTPDCPHVPTPSLTYGGLFLID
jgi:hypothetical protein